MKVVYTIDALNARGDRAWRLMEDGCWRPCTYAEPIREGDARLDTEQAEEWAGQRLRRTRDGRFERKGKPGIFDFWMRGVFAHAVPHHLGRPPRPSREQLVETIRSLTPGTPWLVYLDKQARFRALDTGATSILDNLDIAVRGEIASSPEHIGPKAAEDPVRMDELWRQFLAGWIEHLRTRANAVFVPDAEKLKPEADYLAELAQLEDELDQSA